MPRKGQKGPPISEETRAKMRAAAIAYNQDPAVRERKRGEMKTRYADPVERERMEAAKAASFQRPEVKQRLSDAAKAYNQDPAVRARKSDQMKEHAARPEVREMLSKRAQAMAADPRIQQIRSVKSRAAWSDLSRRLALGESVRERFRDPAYWERIVGPIITRERTPEMRARRRDALLRQKAQGKMMGLKGPPSAEQRDRYSAASKRKWNDPVTRAALLEGGRRSGLRWYRTRTAIERSLADEFKRRGLVFEEQCRAGIIGIVDFMFAGARLVVEADGDYWHTLPGAQERDAFRDAALAIERFKVLRFWEADIKRDVAACVDQVEAAIRARTPS